MLNMSSDDLAQRVLDELRGLHVKVDELVDDARKVRPLMNKYLGLTAKPWLKRGRKDDAA